MSFFKSLPCTLVALIFTLASWSPPVYGAAISGAGATEWNETDESRARLITPFGLEADGKTLWVGLQIELEPGWHSYWKNPGDAGLPPALTFADSIRIRQEFLFPTPKFYAIGGGLDANGYSREVVYPIRLTLSPDLAASKTASIACDFFYLVCKDLCVPQQGLFNCEVDLTRPGAQTSPSSPEGTRLARAIGSLSKAPSEVPGYRATESLGASADGYLVSIAINAPAPWDTFPGIFFHPTPDLKIGSPQFSHSQNPNQLVITIPISPKVSTAKIDTVTLGYLLDFVPLPNKGRVAVEKIAHLKVSATVSVATTTVDEGVSATVGGGSSADTGSRSAELDPATSTDQVAYPEAKFSFPVIILLAILGGFVLNLMPCVLPVLSIKLFSILGHVGEARREVTSGMIASSAGVITSFLLLATAAVIAKNAGQAVGWGVQFQEPSFVSVLAIVVFLFGLNLWGLFEVILPGRVADTATGVSKGGHFAQGLLATLLATPCSAPFLGTAVSFALSSPAWVIFSIFAAIGVGMSLPYLILAAFPRAIKYLPKPGAWMETLKIFFGFLLMGTVVWLMYVLSTQVDSLTMAVVWLGFLTLALVIWLKRSWAPYAPFFGSVGGWVTIIALGATSVFLVQTAIAGRVGDSISTSADGKAGGAVWEPFNVSAIENHLAQGQVVFVDVTAEWCWTCKINEKLFINTADIEGRFRDNNIATIKADWTNRNKEIGAFLASHGRSGIPFYVIFYGGDMKNFIELPVAVTGTLLAEKLDEAVRRNGEVLRSDAN